VKTQLLIVAILLAIAASAQTAPPLPASGSVSLTLDEYNKLADLAAKAPPRVDAPPVASIVKSADINLRVDGEAVSGTLVLEGEVFSKGYRKVPLVSGMVILEAHQRGKELPIEQLNGQHTALLPGPGEFAVTLETGLPLTIEPGRASFSLPVPTAGAVRLTLSVPGDHTQVNLTPGLITRRTFVHDGANDRTTIEATLEPGRPANFWWAARLSAPPPAAPKATRFLSDVKTLISVSEAELAIVALAEITVVQGEPPQFEVQPPQGYEVTSATGPSLVSSDAKGTGLVLHVGPARSYQFLISLRKTNTAAKVEVPLITFTGTQRETGEVLVDGEGAMELTATERGGLRRMDIRETSQYLRALAHSTLYAAFRYQKRPAEMPAVGLEWVRFPESKVLSAVAQEAVVTTLVTSEGRSLTEVKLTLKNQAQPFLKVALPAGASILSAEVAGEKVKPVLGTDGSRVPLLRPGFRPTEAYTVSFVFMHAGVPFEKKGGAELSLPKMDIPIGVVQWEVFLPDRYKLADFGGDAISARLIPPPGEDASEGPAQAPVMAGYVNLESLGAGQIGGVIQDQTGAVVPRATVTILQLSTGVAQQTYTDSRGRWAIGDVPSGRVRVTATMQGFSPTVREINHDANRGSQFNLTMKVGSVTESLVVDGSVADSGAMFGTVAKSKRFNSEDKERPLDTDSVSSNVQDLQKRVAGVLPIAVNVPHAGSSYRFVRPLVVDEETKLTFSYRVK
jgi:hypothetical protein